MPLAKSLPQDDRNEALPCFIVVEMRLLKVIIMSTGRNEVSGFLVLEGPPENLPQFRFRPFLLQNESLIAALEYVK